MKRLAKVLQQSLVKLEFELLTQNSSSFPKTKTIVLLGHACKAVQSCPTLEIPWNIAPQAPLSMGFSRQEHWSGLPCPPPRDLPNPGVKPASLTSPALADGFFTTRATCPFRAPPFTGRDWHGNKLSQQYNDKVPILKQVEDATRTKRKEARCLKRDQRAFSGGGDRESQVGLWGHPTPQDEGKGLCQRWVRRESRWAPGGKRFLKSSFMFLYADSFLHSPNVYGTSPKCQVCLRC